MTPMKIFFLSGTLSLHSMGIGIASSTISVKTLRTETEIVFCGRKEHCSGGAGTTCQFIWYLYSSQPCFT